MSLIFYTNQILKLAVNSGINQMMHSYFSATNDCMKLGFFNPAAYGKSSIDQLQKCQQIFGPVKYSQLIPKSRAARSFILKNKLTA